MAAPRTMTALASDPELQALWYVPVRRHKRFHWYGVGEMALQAAGRNRPVEVGSAVAISRAVDPRVQIRPIGNWQLKELVALPVQISLAASAGANDHIHSFRPRRRNLGECPHSRLIETVRLCVHLELQVGVQTPQDIFVFGKGAEDGLSGWWPRSEMMRGLQVAFHLLRMTRATRLIP